MKRVAIQGIEGSYHEQAAREYFGGETIEIVACETFPELFRRMADDPSLLAVVAIENTIAGSLLPNYDLLCRSELEIIGEHKLHISHCLAALEGETLDTIEEINSHPIALRQCEDFLSTLPHVKVVEKGDTASAARWIAQTNQHHHAAICSRIAARQYGLQILASAIETNKRNFTRFLVLADRWYAESIQTNKTINKSSLVFSLPHTEGSLSKVLTILSFYGINLTKIQSLPIIGREWEYQFHVDLTFTDRIRFQQSIDAIRPLTKDLKIFGQYPEYSAPMNLSKQ